MAPDTTFYKTLSQSTTNGNRSNNMAHTFKQQQGSRRAYGTAVCVEV